MKVREVIGIVWFMICIDGLEVSVRNSIYSICCDSFFYRDEDLKEGNSIKFKWDYIL